MTKGKTSVAALASLCLMLASVLTPAATTGAEAANVAVPAQLYVGSGDGYSIAFEVEGEKVYVLSLDAEVYCSYTEPGELFKPRLYGFFPLPKLMREGHSGLIANESNGDNFGSETTFVQASLSGDKLVGKFGYDLSVESSHCQAGSYFPEPHSVDFEATRYVPASSPEASLPVAGESKIYFLDEEPLEVFIRVEGSELFLRGSVVSRCRFEARPAGRRSLFRSPTSTTLGDGGQFDSHARYRGKIRKGRRFFEPVSLTGEITGEAINGTYSRAIVTEFGSGRRHRCALRPLAFDSVRYLPTVKG
jgi:hypothetical protein